MVKNQMVSAISLSINRHTGQVPCAGDIRRSASLVPKEKDRLLTTY